MAMEANLMGSTILNSLRIGQQDARVTRACILEGELVVYDDSVYVIDIISL